VGRAGAGGGAGDEDRIVAYLRIVSAGVRSAEVSLGRMVTAPEVRRTGLGRALVTRGLAAVASVPVRISAQEHLEPFYTEHGFRRASETYLQDGIPHGEMLRA
jgi:ElaA protein